MKIKIKNLRLRAIIGLYEWEREKKQDVVINIEIEFEGKRAVETESIEDSVDYKTITKRVIQEVEASQFLLLEKLAHHILQIVMDVPSVQKASVEVDKPHALRFADSVSITCSAEREA